MVRGTLLAARVGLAHWFFGNLYEAIVRVPDRLAAERVERRGLLSPGSPFRYYVPTTPLTVAAVALTVARGWSVPDDRAALTTAGSATALGAALTAVLVPTTVVPLLTPGSPCDGAERRRLLRRWHRLNGVRLALAGVAAVALEQVAAGERPRS